MKRTIGPNPTSWDLPLSGRSDLRTGSRGQEIIADAKERLLAIDNTIDAEVIEQ